MAAAGDSTHGCRGHRVQVCVRLRPGAAGEEPRVLPVDARTLRLLHGPGATEYRFDAVYGPGASQSDVYLGSVRPLLSHLAQGRNVTVLAYGPSAAGKTYTMLGSAEEPGVIPRAVRDLLGLAGPCATVTASYLEIYQERLVDLFAPPGPPLRLRDTSPPAVPGLTEVPVRDAAAFERLFVPAARRRRRAAATRLNAASSRGHALLLLRLRPPGVTLLLGDLAGAEDNRRTGNAGRRRLRESGAINASLGALRRVVAALARGDGRRRRHPVPYRDSKLTRALRDALGGSARALLLAAVAPGPREAAAARAALDFAAAAAGVVNRDVVVAAPPEPPSEPEPGDGEQGAADVPDTPQAGAPASPSLLRRLDDAQELLEKLKARHPPTPAAPRGAPGTPPPSPPQGPGVRVSPAEAPVVLLRRKGGGGWEARRRPELLAAAGRRVLRGLNGDPGALRRVGTRRARRLLAWRRHRGPFARLEDLAEVPGFSAATVAALLEANLPEALESPESQ
ncbi:kinesin-like protein KIF22 [Dromaius novaehollandiae]|uniref:kinesin-like protein KIF22 n=1 Tax=Dromaius novaehollandiae TaxID=8790 RepID=UPI00311EC29C